MDLVGQTACINLLSVPFRSFRTHHLLSPAVPYIKAHTHTHLYSCPYNEQVCAHPHTNHTTHSYDDFLIHFLSDRLKKKKTIHPFVRKIAFDTTYPAPSSQSSLSLSAAANGKAFPPLASPLSLTLLFLSVLFFYPSLRRCPWLCSVPVSLCQVTSLILQAIRVRTGDVYEAGTKHTQAHTHT